MEELKTEIMEFLKDCKPAFYDGKKVTLSEYIEIAKLGVLAEINDNLNLLAQNVRLLAIAESNRK